MVTSNILDPVHDVLDPTVWDAVNETHPVLKPQHKDWILSTVHTTLKHHGYGDMDKWLEVYLTGSLTTFQYSDESDCDISLFVNTDVFPEWSRAEMIALFVDKVDGTKLPGTTHPMQCFVVAQGIRPEDLYQPGLRSGYEILHSRWLIPPERNRAHDVEREQNSDYQWALEQADKMERLLRYEPDKAVTFWHQIHSRRRRDQQAGKGDYSQSNIIYKFLANRGLFPQISDVSGEYIAKTAMEQNPLPRNLDDHWLTWQPGTTGKGFILENGKVWHWPTENFRPMHLNRVAPVKAMGGRVRSETAFHIDPEGGVYVNGPGRKLDDLDVARLQMADRRLKPTNVSQGGGYGHSQEVYNQLRGAKTAGAENSALTQDFFSDAATGGHAPHQPLMPQHVSQDPAHQKFLENMRPFHGPFDEHIETSIPDFRSNTLRTGTSLLNMGGGKLLDIAGSTGAWGKALSGLSNGAWETHNLEPNDEMIAHFNQHPVQGAHIIPEAFGGSFEDNGKVVPHFRPKGDYDAVHESMGFQFMSPDRASQVAEAKAHLKPGGLFLSEQKFHTDNEAANEHDKDVNFKAHYYVPEQLQRKNEQVGFQEQGPMMDNLVHHRDFENTLGQHFKHHAPYWQSGNFMGYAASDDPDKLQTFLDGVNKSRNAKTVGKLEDTKHIRLSKQAGLMPHPDRVEEARQRLDLKHHVRFLPTYRDIRGGYAGMDRDPQTDQESHLIYFNPTQHPGAKNWSAWHELAHAAQNERGEVFSPTVDIPQEEYSQLPKEHEAEEIANRHADLDLWKRHSNTKGLNVGQETQLTSQQTSAQDGSVRGAHRQAQAVGAVSGNLWTLPDAATSEADDNRPHHSPIDGWDALVR